MRLHAFTALVGILALTMMSSGSLADPPGASGAQSSDLAHELVPPWSDREANESAGEYSPFRISSGLNPYALLRLFTQCKGCEHIVTRGNRSLDEAEELDAEVVRLSDQIHDTRTEIKSITEQWEKTVQKLGVADLEGASVQELEKLRAERDALQTERSELEGRVSDLENRKERLKARRDQAWSEYDRAENDLRACETRNCPRMEEETGSSSGGSAALGGGAGASSPSRYGSGYQSADTLRAGARVRDVDEAYEAYDKARRGRWTEKFGTYGGSFEDFYYDEWEGNHDLSSGDLRDALDAYEKARRGLIPGMGLYAGSFRDFYHDKNGWGAFDYIPEEDVYLGPGEGASGLLGVSDLALGHELRKERISVLYRPDLLTQLFVLRQIMILSMLDPLINAVLQSGSAGMFFRSDPPLAMLPWTYTFAAIVVLAYLEDQPVDPNDPLFEDRGVGKTVSNVAKGVGKLLGGFGGFGGFGGGGMSVAPALESEAKDQWGLHKVGYTARENATSAWNIEDGAKENIVVAVIDSGLDMDHVDGPQYIWTSKREVPGNGLDDDGNGYVDDVHGWNFFHETDDLTDDYGHGSFVAGIIAAKRNNGIGISGINPGARIMVLKVGSKQEPPHGLSLYRALRYAVDNGAQVINVSLGGKGHSQLLQAGLNYAHAMGRFVVVAAGNDMANIDAYSPPGLRRGFVVGALDMDDDPRRSSNYGSKVSITAPGESIYSISAKQGLRDGVVMPKKDTQYHRLSGTSFAAPFVAATASLMWAKNPDLSNVEIEDILVATAKDLGEKGWDRKTGAGLLDAYRALALSKAQGLTIRVTDLVPRKDGRKLKSLDIYGIVRGSLDSYSIELGKGRDPSGWKDICESSTGPLDHGLMCSIEGKRLRWGDEWTLRIKAKDAAGNKYLAHLPFSLD